MLGIEKNKKLGSDIEKIKQLGINHLMRLVKVCIKLWTIKRITLTEGNFDLL